MASINNSNESQTSTLKPTSMHQFWLFDGLGRNGHLADEVELLARRCKTVSPNAVKELLIYEKRPNTAIGFPLYNKTVKKKAILHSKFRRQTTTPTNPKEESFRKVLDRFQPPKNKNVSIGPGYVLSRGKHEVTAKIRTDHSIDAGDRNISSPLQKGEGENEKKNLVDEGVILELKKEIDDLTTALEEEKYRHRTEVDQINENHDKELTKFQNEHAEHIRAVQLDFEDDLKDIEEKHRAIVAALENRATQERNELSSELETAQTALETYKVNIAKELKSKWEEYQLELELEHERNVENLLAKQKKELQTDKNKALDAMTKEHKRHVTRIVESNRKEMNTLVTQYDSCYNEAKQLKGVYDENEQLKVENEEMKITLEKSQTLNRNLQNELHDLKVKLNMFKGHFAEKVAEVDEKYASKINNLMMDNAKIRQQYLKKCEELYSVKSEVETQKIDSLFNARDALQKIILSRTRADVSLTVLREDTANEVLMEQQRTGSRTHVANKEIKPKRPSTAPSTDRETRQAVRDSSKGASYSTSQSRSSRPTSSTYRQPPIPPYERRTPEQLLHFIEEPTGNTLHPSSPLLEPQVETLQPEWLVVPGTYQ